MPDGRGGYRRPVNPAPTSGPGALSRRTDGQPVMDLPNAKYGENAAYVAAQQGAPLASAPPLTTPSGDRGVDLSQITGLGEASTQPDTPVTSGAAAGPGAGPDVLGLPQAPKQEEAMALAKYLPAMINVANEDDATPGFKRYVRELLANL